MRALALIVAVTLAGVLLRAVALSESLFGDELSAYFVVVGNDPGRLLELVGSDQEVTPPLFFLLARATHGIGDSLRWVPFVAGVASIPLTYVLGLLTVGRRAALTAAAVIAASPFLIFFSSEARPYALLTALCLGSTIALLRGVDEGPRWWWVLYAVLAAAAMYTHYTAVFLLAAQFGWALACHRHAWPWLIGASAAAALLWAPWLAEYLADQDSPGSALIGALQPFEWDSAWTSVFRWAVGHPFAPSSIGEVPGDRALVPIGLGLLIGLTAIGVQAIRDRVGRPSDGVVLVVVLALSTPVLAALYSAVGDSVFLPRNMIASSPGLALLLGAIVTAPRSRPAWVAATALLLAGFALAGVRMLEDAAQRPDYEAAAEFIAERSDGERVVVDAHGPGPSPLSPLDAAIADGAVRPDTVALRLGRATLDDQWRAGQPDGPGQFAPLPVPAPESIARQALAQSTDGRLFLVHPGRFTFAELRGDAEGSRADVASTLPAAAFARALPAGYRAGATQTFPGLFGGGDVTVYELVPE